MSMLFDLAMYFMIGCLVRLGKELTRSPDMLELFLVTCDVPGSHVYCFGVCVV